VSRTDKKRRRNPLDNRRAEAAKLPSFAGRPKRYPAEPVCRIETWPIQQIEPDTVAAHSVSMTSCRSFASGLNKQLLEASARNSVPLASTVVVLNIVVAIVPNLRSLARDMHCIGIFTAY
jgi:hypothetical protein